MSGAGGGVVAAGAPKRLCAPIVLFTRVIEDKLRSPVSTPHEEVLNYTPWYHGRSIDYWLERAGDLYSSRLLSRGAARCWLLSINGGPLDHPPRFLRLVRNMPRLRALRLRDVRGVDLAMVFGPRLPLASPGSLPAAQIAPELRELEVANCEFRGALAPIFAPLCGRILALTVRNCRLTHADVRALAAALLSPTCILYRLSIADPLLCADAHARVTLCDAISRNRSLVDVDVSQATPEGAHVVLRQLNDAVEMMHNRHLLVIRARALGCAFLGLFEGDDVPTDLQDEFDRAQRRMAVNRRRLWCVTAERVVAYMRAAPVPAIIDADAYLDLLEPLQVPCCDAYDANSAGHAPPWYMVGIPRNALGRILPLLAERMPYSGRAAEAACLWLRHLSPADRVTPSTWQSA